MVESVFIPMNGLRGTQCISSQVGCSLACTFCHTGTQKLLRNLTPGEIISQYMIPAKDYGDLPLVKNVQRNVSNIVFMGQGEPLYNWRYPLVPRSFFLSFFLFQNLAVSRRTKLSHHMLIFLVCPRFPPFSDD